MIASEPPDLPGRLAAEIHRVSERLRAIPLGRLAAPLPPYASRAEAGHAVAQRLATAAQGIEARKAPQPPAWRDVPKLADQATADLIAVTGRDLLNALAAADPAADTPAAAADPAADTPADGAVGPAATAWTPTGRRPIHEIAEQAVAALRELRLAL